MTHGPSDKSSAPPVTTRSGQSGISVSVNVATQAGVFGARTVYQPAVQPTCSQVSSTTQEPVPKKRKVETNPVSGTTQGVSQPPASAASVQAMQQYNYMQMLQVNQLLINQLTQNMLTIQQGLMAPKPIPQPEPHSKLIAPVPRELVRQRLLQQQSGIKETSQPAAAMDQQKKEAAEKLKLQCEITSNQISRFCGVHIAPARLRQLFRETPGRLLGFIKNKYVRKGNYLISTKLLALMTPQQKVDLRDLCYNLYQFARKYRQSQPELIEAMLESAYEQGQPPQDRSGGLGEVLNYYVTELNAAGLNITFAQLLNLLRQDVDETAIWQWLTRLALRDQIKKGNYGNIVELIEVADSHCRYFRHYTVASTELEPSTPPGEEAVIIPEPAVVTTDTPPARATPESESPISPEPETTEPLPAATDDGKAKNTLAASQAVAPPDIPFKQEFPGIPNSGNYCYMICAIQHLRATMPREHQQALIEQWRAKQTDNPEVQPETVPEAFSALLSIMAETREKTFARGGFRRHLKQIERTFLHFAVLCKQNDTLNSEINGRLVRRQKGADYIKYLKQNDTQGFLMKLQQVLGLESQNQVDLFEQLTLELGGEHFSKPQTRSGLTNVLMVALAPEGDIQKSLDAHFEDTVLCRWSPEELLNREGLPEQEKEGYPTRHRVEIKADPARLKRFTLCLKNTEVQNIAGHFSDWKVQKACTNSIDHVFRNIHFSVTHPETGEKINLTARPEFIIAHDGDNYQSGHYVALRLQDMGWVLNDDDRPATLLLKPEAYLKHNNAYPYLIDYQIVGSA